MAKKPDLNEHVSLLFELYNRIPRLGKITAGELQQQLADIGLVRDIRTIQRNLDILVIHLNVYKDSRDKPYGYHRDSLPIKTFGPRESILLNLAERWLTKSFPVEYRSIINSIFTEIHQLKTQTNAIKRDGNNSYSEVQAQPLITNYSASFNAVFEQLTYGIIRQQIVNIVVNDEELNTEPLGFYIAGNKLFVVFRAAVNDYRHIEIERIQEACLSTFNFEYPKNFSLLAYQNQSSLKHQSNASANITPLEFKRRGVKRTDQ